jgi:hypothetical protein
MRIDVRDAERRKIGRIEVDPAQRPTRVRVEGADREVFLDWDTALDDAHHLRRCIVCGCNDLFRAKVFPQITGLVVVLAFAGAVLGVFGQADTPLIQISMVVVLVADVSILLLSRQRLVCHRCRSSYHGLSIARYHRRWDRAVAERHATPAEPAGGWARRLRWPWTLRARPAARAGTPAATRERTIA